MTTSVRLEQPQEGFRHELYPYLGDDAFLHGALGFIQEALDAREGVIVSVPGDREALLRAELPDSKSVTFVDAATPGRNPGRLLAVWQDEIARHAAEGRPLRGIGESAWHQARTPSEAAELRYHEWLLNLAFAQSTAWWLLCPYDTADEDPASLQALTRCHPLIRRDGTAEPSADYDRDAPYTFEELTGPCGPLDELSYARGDLAAVREKITACAAEADLPESRLSELLLAATEVATNSIRHGGGHGTLRTWTQDATFICEFRDTGHIENPLAGRIRPTYQSPGGRGLWLVHQLCDLVEIRSTPQTGTTIRLHTSVGDSSQPGQ
ncbi:sensor histidine kinase [Streptomyces sp. ISL-94]|uniref:sensor histidine kinase n=1 Tax=Streptomyces sp. ISL-94 TaxID=2819190 RepID=UPI001BE4F4D2|nr:sensor histidine kinase [Streptomyces sp. ISL-94]MBT2481402.1 sensor histidine kinase [Streptomyces sp. ISL-94]